MGTGQSMLATQPVRRTAPSGHPAGLPALLGGNRAFVAAMELARRVADYPGANVLLVGETGTGKEMFARAIHNGSPNAGDPFVAINCSAIPETMLESELFGHEKGAFTDARTPKKGLLEVAGCGSVLLDEINELPLNLQPKLLRVLEERRVRRLGAVQEYEVRCRIIAATNRDLAALSADGSFRSDLYYRLNVMRVEIPPLRDRLDDVEPLAHHFVERSCREHGIPCKRLSPEVMPLLQAHGWLGNVRELKNAIERAVLLCDGDTIGPAHVHLRARATVPTPGDVLLGRTGGQVPGPGTNGGAAVPAASAAQDDGVVLHIPAEGMTLAEMERLLIHETLRRTAGNRSRAARMLGISRPTIIRKIEQYGIEA